MEDNRYLYGRQRPITPTIIYGPPAAGKTRHAEYLRKLFDCDSVVDEWDGKAPVSGNVLVLTSAEIEPREWSRLRIIDIRTLALPTPHDPDRMPNEYVATNAARSTRDFVEDYYAAQGLTEMVVPEPKRYLHWKAIPVSPYSVLVVVALLSAGVTFLYWLAST